jgi:hypothetical protein
MNDLKPSTQALLDLGRLGDDPTDAAIGRNRRALAKKLGVATLAASALAGSTSKVASAVAAGSWTTAKVALLCGAVAAGGAATWGVIHERNATPRADDSSAGPPMPAKLARRDTVAPAVVPPEAPTPPEAATAATASSPAPVTHAAPSSRASNAPSIKQELELVRAAQHHLNRGEPQAALALLAEHAQKFPSGVLWEEREASRVFALCRMGNAADARALADAFVRRAPRSPFVDRVRASCREPSPPATR